MDFYAFRCGEFIFDDGTTKFEGNVVKLEYFNLKKKFERFWQNLAVKFQFRTFLGAKNPYTYVYVGFTKTQSHLNYSTIFPCGKYARH